MFGRSDDDVEQVAATEWTKRIDRLLAGNLNQQVGSTLESLAREFAELARRVEGLAELRDQLSALASTVAESSKNDRLTEAVASIERRIDELAKPADVASAVREITARLAALESATTPGVSAEQVSEIVSGKLEASQQQVENLGRQVGGALGRLRVQNDELAASIAAIADAVRAMPETDSITAMLREEREAADRRNETLVQQTAAVLGSVISSMGEMRNQLGALEHRPDVPAALRDEIVRLLDDAIRPALDRLAELDERLAALPGGARVDELSASIRELQEEMRKERSEQFSTLSASVGAIYLRVRALEQATADLRSFAERDGEDTRGQISTMLERLNEVASLEKRLANDIEAMQRSLLARGGARPDDPLHIDVDARTAVHADE